MQALTSIPIRIDPLFWLLAFGLGFYYSGSIPGTLIWGSIVLISVLFHELGHAITARLFGQQASITLTFFGGVTKRDGPSISKFKEFLIVLNGPLAGFLLALIALKLSTLSIVAKHPLLQTSLNIAYAVNVFWTIINLLPIQPLDGGHLLMILFQGIFGFRGIKIAYFLSGLLAALLGFVLFFFHQVFLGAILLIFAFDSFRSWKSSLIMSKVDHNESLQDEVKDAEQDISHGNMTVAKIKLQNILERHQAQGGVLVLKVVEMLAKILFEEGKVENAYALLSPYKKNLDMEGLKLLHQSAFKSHQNKDAIELGTYIHQEMATSETALINALAAAELKDPQATLGWLKTAIDEGLPNPQIVLQNQRFDFLKMDPEFQNLLKT